MTIRCCIRPATPRRCSSTAAASRSRPSRHSSRVPGVQLAPGSRIDVSGGGQLTTAGALNAGVGGSDQRGAEYALTSMSAPASAAAPPRLELGATLSGYGLYEGGSLCADRRRGLHRRRRLQRRGSGHAVGVARAARGGRLQRLLADGRPGRTDGRARHARCTLQAAQPRAARELSAARRSEHV